MRVDRAWLVLLLGLPACSSGSTDGSTSGDAAPEATTLDAAISRDGNADAATYDAAVFADARSDTGTGGGDGAPTSCMGMAQSLKGTCVLSYVDAGPPIGCIEFTGSEFAADPATIMATCASACGSACVSQYTTQPCPTAALVGECIDSCGQPNESVDHYYSGTATATSAQQACGSTSPPGYFVP